MLPGVEETAHIGPSLQPVDIVVQSDRRPLPLRQEWHPRGSAMPLERPPQAFRICVNKWNASTLLSALKTRRVRQAVKGVVGASRIHGIREQLCGGPYNVKRNSRIFIHP